MFGFNSVGRAVVALYHLLRAYATAQTRCEALRRGRHRAGLVHHRAARPRGAAADSYPAAGCGRASDRAEGFVPQPDGLIRLGGVRLRL